MKSKLYLETTIPSLLTGWPSRDLQVAAHQQATAEWWRRRKDDYDIYISKLVLDEAADGDPEAARLRLGVLAEFPLLNATEEAEELAAKFLAPNLLPPKAAKDAAHIALATVHEMHFLLTWNCAHINNATVIPAITRICRENGWELPLICTPEELLGD